MTGQERSGICCALVLGSRNSVSIVLALVQHMAKSLYPQHWIEKFLKMNQNEPRLPVFRNSSSFDNHISNLKSAPWCWCYDTRTFFSRTVFRLVLSLWLKQKGCTILLLRATEASLAAPSLVLADGNLPAGKRSPVDNDHPSSWSAPSISSKTPSNDANTLILTVEPCDFRLSCDKVNVCTLGRRCFVWRNPLQSLRLMNLSCLEGAHFHLEQFAITFLQKVLINIY